MRETTVVEARGLPSVDAVAHLAGSREARGAVIHHRGLLIVPAVATVALGAQARINSDGPAGVAQLAIHCGMSPQ